MKPRSAARVFMVAHRQEGYSSAEFVEALATLMAKREKAAFEAGRQSEKVEIDRLSTELIRHEHLLLDAQQRIERLKSDAALSHYDTNSGV